MYRCSVCNKDTKRLYPDNTCQSCYNYFRHGGEINPIPRHGEITYDSRGYVVCHICGKAFKRLGSHIKESHETTIAQYKEMYGLCSSAKTTELNYSQHMKDLAYRYDMDKRLQEAGKRTRIKKGEKMRLGKKSRLQECLNRSKSIKNGNNI